MDFYRGAARDQYYQRSEEITMLGNSFVLVNQNGQLLASGMVMQKVAEGNYLCRFRGKVPSSRVVNVDQMGNWLFFDDEDHLGAWMAENARQTPPAQPEGEPEPDAPPAEPEAPAAPKVRVPLKRAAGSKKNG